MPTAKSNRYLCRRHVDHEDDVRLHADHRYMPAVCPRLHIISARLPRIIALLLADGSLFN